jgi:methionine-rich copper-binding protein CopC
MAAGASPASAHDELIGTDPAADSTLDASPSQLTLTFSADIASDAGASEVQVTDAAGTALAGEPTVQDNVLTVPLTAEASGAVIVLWKVVSSDGHPISGEFGFTVTPPTTPTPTPTPSAVPTTTAEPTPSASPAPADPASGAVWPWIVGGLVVAALAGGILYLVVSRARREKALAAGPAAGGHVGSEAPPER